MLLFAHAGAHAQTEGVRVRQVLVFVVRVEDGLLAERDVVAVWDAAEGVWGVDAEVGVGFCFG